MVVKAELMVWFYAIQHKIYNVVLTVIFDDSFVNWYQN